MGAIKRIVRVMSIFSLIIGISLIVNGIIIYKNMKEVQSLQQQGSQFILLYKNKIEAMVSINPQTQIPSFTTKEALKTMNTYEDPIEIYLTSIPHDKFIVVIDVKKRAQTQDMAQAIEEQKLLENKLTPQESKDYLLLTTISSIFNVEDSGARAKMITQMQEGTLRTYPEIKAIKMIKIIPEPLIQKAMETLIN